MADTRTETPPQVVTIALGSLVPNTDYQPRGLSEPPDSDQSDPERWWVNLDPGQLESLRASLQEVWPPLLVTPSESQPGHYDLLDGFHRYAVALERAQTDQPTTWYETTIACHIIDDGGIDTAIAANIHHGLPLSLEDRKAAARLFHQWDPELSYRHIAARVGLSDKTVKAALTGTTPADFPQLTDQDLAPVVRTSSDPIQKLVKLAVAASRERTGTGWVAKLFSRKTDQQQQVDYVARIIRGYRDADQALIARGVAVMGQILIDGAGRFLGDSTP
jgi:ParB-like chromosome segregation protein Spo0J